MSNVAPANSRRRSSRSRLCRGGCAGSQREDSRCFGDSEGSEVAAGGGGDDTAAGPVAAVASGGDQAGDAVVGAAGPGADGADARVVEDQVVVGQIEAAGGGDAQRLGDQDLSAAGGE